MSKKSLSKVDPHLAREQEKYENPIPSREYILELLQKADAPVKREVIAEQLMIHGDERLEALRRRLRAMERDGQIVYIRNGSFGLPERMDMITGRVLGHRDGFGFLRPDDGGNDLFLGPKQMHGVFHGDHVMAQPLGVDRKGRRDARVVRVLEHARSELVGRYFVDAGIGFVVPDDVRIAQDIVVPQEASRGARNGQVVLVKITSWPTRQNSPTGEVIEVMGDEMDPGMEIEIALRNHDLPHEWPKAVEQQAAEFTEQVPEAAKKGRVDLRHLPLVTIDGEDARDFDDAVYCETKKSGGWRLWVAIADVSHYVRHGSALDLEAINRGNSVYFPENVIPMLPEVLSNGLCSLNPKVDRLCMVAEMTVSASGKLSGYKFYPALMNSHARLTYNKVAAMLDGDQALRSEYEPLVPHLEELHRLYDTLTAARDKRGAIAFETTETQFVFNAQRKIDKIVPLVRNDAHKMIEECMILANVAAARFVEKHEGAALFRVHDSPGEEKLKGFREFLGELGLSLSGGEEPTPADYSALLEKAKDRPDAELIQIMLLRSMKQAVYEPENGGHFGLALSSYAHFTSPIRRYPDLVLHRTIKYLLAKEQGQAKDQWTPLGGFHYPVGEVENLGVHCSMTERRADDATRDVADWLKCEYMLDHVGDTFGGTISTVTSFGCFVRLDDLHIEGLVHISNFPGDYYHFDGSKHRLVGESSGTTYHMGDRLQVKVMAVNLDDKKIELAMESFEGGKKRLRSKPGKTGKKKAKPLADSGAPTAKTTGKSGGKQKGGSPKAADQPLTGKELEKAKKKAKQKKRSSAKKRAGKNARAKAKAELKHKV